MKYIYIHISNINICISKTNKKKIKFIKTFFGEIQDHEIKDIQFNFSLQNNNFIYTYI